LLSREYPPETGWGGMGAYTYQMAHALTEVGHDVEVVSLRKEGESEPSTATTQVGSKQIIIHRAPWTPVLSELKMFPLLSSTLYFENFICLVEQFLETAPGETV
jgi:hypothetical protein